MPKSCCAVGCHNHNQMERRISLFTFPKNDEQRKERWIEACNRINPDGTEWRPSRQAVLCEDHFISGMINIHVS